MLQIWSCGRNQTGARPEHIRTAWSGDQGVLRLTVDVTQHLGHETLLDVNNNGRSAVVRVAATERFEIGETRDFSFDLNKIQFFDPETGTNAGLPG
jgi:multiple sugar transport system ATP-binding protein